MRRWRALFAGGFEIFLLADVADHGDNFAAIISLSQGMMMEVSSPPE